MFSRVVFSGEFRGGFGVFGVGYKRDSVEEYVRE